MQPAIRGALATCVLAASAAHALTVVADPANPGQYSATFQGGHSVADTYADVFDFMSPVDGTLTFTFQAQLLPIQSSPGLAPFVGVLFFAYQVSETPPITFANPLSQPVRVVGPLPITQGPHVLTLGVSVIPSPFPELQVSTDYSGTIVITPTPIPEPETWLLMASGLLTGLAYRGRRTTTARGTWPSSSATSPTRASARKALGSVNESDSRWKRSTWIS